MTDALATDLPEDWRDFLATEFEQSWWRDLEAFVASERRAFEVYPPAASVFEAFRRTSLRSVKVVLLGQDPYHGPGQAHGLCFSVRPDVRIPPSLGNMYRELETDIGVPAPSHGFLAAWAEQGILMLNAVLTVRAHEPNSHKGRGWERWTDSVIARLSARDEPVVFALWGGYARKKGKLVNRSVHRVVETGHPSPLSMKHFVGTRPFSAINRALVELGRDPIDWRLPEVVEP